MFCDHIQADELDGVVNSLDDAIVSKHVLRLLLKRQWKQRTEDWYKIRTTLLTASECASALNLNKYCSKQDLIKKKLGLVESSGGNAATAHGIKYEDEAADIYAARNPHLVPFFEIGLIRHDQHSFLGASPDRVTKDGILIEIKVVF